MRNLILRVPILNGKYDEHALPFEDKDYQVIIGRSQEGGGRRIVTPIYQEGVSRNHGGISYFASTQKFILQDLNSTYGTEVENPEINPGKPKILKGQDSLPIGPGTKIVLAFNTRDRLEILVEERREE